MTVSKQIIEVIDALCEKFGIVIDWTAENVIPYVETLCTKIISYEIATSFVWMAIMILLSIGSIVATKKFAPIFKRGIQNQKYLESGWTIGSIFAIIGLVGLNLATLIVSVVQIMDIIEANVFPEKTIYDFVTYLIQYNQIY